MELYIIRHGQTDWNKDKKIQGRTDRSITIEGVEQIEETASLLNNIDFDEIYVSPLLRAVQTAKILLGNENFKLDDRIMEIGFGFLEGAVYKDIKFKNPEEFSEDEKRIVKFFKSPDNYEPAQGGESYQSMMNRIESFLTDIQKKHDKNDKIMIVSHATIIHGMLIKALNQPLKDIWKIDVPNGAITKIIVEDGKLILDGEAIKNTEF